MSENETGDTGVEQITCPWRFCGIEMGHTEMVAHLQWDHNVSETQAKAMLDYE